MIEFRDFTIDEVFQIKKGKRLDRNKIPLDAFDGSYPYVSRTESENMVSDWIDYDKSFLSEGNVLALGMDTFVFAYQAKPFFTGDKIKIAILRDRVLNESIAMYLITAIRKAMASLSWGMSMDEKKLKKIKIELPVDESDKPNWSYMEKYINGIKKNVLSEKVKSYINYLVEDNDQTVLVEQKNFREVIVGDLFSIKPTKNYGMTNDSLFKTQGDVPVISNISYNNGVIKYIGLEPTEKKGILTFSDTGTYATESIFFQPNDFIGYSHVQGMYPLFDPSILTENVGLYLATVIRKAVAGVYDYSRKFTRDSLLETSIKLPINESDEIDWLYMEGYIKALKSNLANTLVNKINEVE
ncbi:restriction endonuclease subunit S [Viridibacillus arvi]|uniref:restriction endonuclease subunit S n=1 Tax=Viridibacillus arvi TaxID=263475 RepID=UPI003D038CBF